MADGDRTRDLRSHNPVLYQLSYGHHSSDILQHLVAVLSSGYLLQPIWLQTESFLPNQHHLVKMARPAGLEPATIRLEGGCSIQLSYGRKVNPENWSGQRDSNPRHPAPKAGALPDCAMPRFSNHSHFFDLAYRPWGGCLDRCICEVRA